MYRATRDGFTSLAFHYKFDEIDNTITIIKNDLNYVFSEFTTSAWHSYGNLISDPNAFLFSLRRGGVSFKDKFIVKEAEYALFGDEMSGPSYLV